jgi:hypothetical protein
MPALSLTSMSLRKKTGASSASFHRLAESLCHSCVAAESTTSGPKAIAMSDFSMPLYYSFAMSGRASFVVSCRKEFE